MVREMTRKICFSAVFCKMIEAEHSSIDELQVIFGLMAQAVLGL